MEDLTEYPQAAPAKRSHRRAWSIAAGCVIVAGLVVAAAVVVPPMVAQANAAAATAAQIKAQAAVPAAPLGDATTGDEQQTLSDSDAAGAQAIADEKAAEAAQAAALAAQQAAAQAAAAEKAKEASEPHGAPAGTPVPFIASSDPNNANGGDYEDPGIFCASHSASTVNGVPVCD
jgi:hypothetical protein